MPVRSAERNGFRSSSLVHRLSGWDARCSRAFYREKAAEASTCNPGSRLTDARANAPDGAIVLFDGSNLDASGRRRRRDWLKQAGAAPGRSWTAASECAGSDGSSRRQSFGDMPPAPRITARKARPQQLAFARRAL